MLFCLIDDAYRPLNPGGFDAYGSLERLSDSEVLRLALFQQLRSLESERSFLRDRYVNEATLSEGMRWVVRVAFPLAALLMALGFFLSVLSPEAREPNALINLTFVAGLLLAVGLLVLGIGLIRGRRTSSEPA